MQKSKSCKKLHAKIEKVAKSCNIKFLETAQNIELYISWVFRKLLEAVKKSCKSCKNLPYAEQYFWNTECEWNNSAVTAPENEI